jgi:hypothetical protein
MGVLLALLACDDGLGFRLLRFDLHRGSLILEDTVEGVFVAWADEVFLGAS